MKILFVIDNLSTGGAQRQMVNLAIGLINKGHEVRIFCYTAGDMLAQPLRDAGVLIYWHEKRSRYSLNVVSALYKVIANEPLDLVLSFLPTPNFYSLISGRLAKGRKLRIIVSERSCDLTQGISRMEWLVRQSYRLTDHLVFNSYHQKDNFVQKYPFLHNRISTIYNGFDLNTFVPPANEPNNNPMRILCIASVSPYKNGLCMIEALNILHKKYQAMFSVTWIGQRVMKGERLAYLKDMEYKIDEYGLRKYWCWLDQRTDIIQQLQQHDVLVHPSFGEGLPNVVCEALACGRPVIVSNTLDHPRLVQDGQSGYLFDWQNPSELAEKIKLLNKMTPAERSNVGKKGRQFAESHLSMDRYVDEYEQLFTSLLKENKQ